MAGPGQYFLHGALLDDLARVHHRELMADLRDDRQVVGDEDQAGARFPAQPRQQPQDLVLNGDVERGGRLVAQDQRRLAGQRDRDHHALPHAAGELMRERAEPSLGIGDADAPHQLQCPVSSLPPGQAEVHLRGLGDLAADPHDRVERAHRLLEDHRDLGAADLVQLRSAELGQVGTVQDD